MIIRSHCPEVSRDLFIFEPERRTIRGQIIFMHGLCEHGLRHVPLAKRLASDATQRSSRRSLRAATPTDRI